MLEAEQGRWRSREEQLNKALLGREQELTDLLQDRNLLKMEHNRAVQTLQDKLGNQTARLNDALQGKESEVGNLRQDLQLSKIEYEQAVQSMQDELKAARADSASQQHDMAELHQSDKSELINKYQGQIDDKSAAISNLTSEIDRLQSSHATNVAELEGFFLQCKEDVRAVKKKHAESLETAS